MEEAGQATNYHVLAERSSEGAFSLDGYKNHIGNSRFEVLIDMYREAFEISLSKGQDDECQKIAERIAEVVCHKNVATAVQRGRFLFKDVDDNESNDWKECDDAQAKALVYDVLLGETDEVEPLEDAAADMVPSAQVDQSDMFGDRKRGRRRSLLRRSASESTMLEDKKKLIYRPQGESESQEPSDNPFGAPGRGVMPASLSRQVSTPVNRRPPIAGLARQLSVPAGPATLAVNGMGSSLVLVPHHKGMDVVLSSGARKFSNNSNIVGNNRLQVLVTLQQGRFPELSPADQNKVATDLVKAVCQYWGGRILVEYGFQYRELGNEEAVTAFMSLLSSDSTDTRMSPLVKSASPSLLASAPQPPDFLKQTSIELLGGGLDMQSAAIKSLQQRKAKRGLAKKLGQGGAGQISGTVPSTFVRLNNLGPQS